MTRLHILSDLHFEMGKMPRSYKPPECDVVILAGDIASGVVGIMWAQETFQVPVIYVPGNHEYYGKRVIDKHLEKMRVKADGSNVHLLNNAEVEIDGVRFVGSTMWTDHDLYGNAPVAEQQCQTGMNDYRQILTSSYPKRFLSARDTSDFHRASRYYVSEALRQDQEKKTVVVTHHAPSELSCLPRYRNDPITPAFASRLEGLICDRAPALWVHGHMHNNSDYMICDTRIVCNPRGYYGHELNADFDPTLVVEI